MKKALAAVLIILIALSLVSCSYSKSAEAVLHDFCMEYPIDSRIYSSLADTWEAGYIDSEMLYALYGMDEHPVREYAVVMYGKVDTVREIGVFIIENGQDKILLTELISGRIGFLSSFAEGEGFVKSYKGVMVYGFVENSARAQELFDRII